LFNNKSHAFWLFDWGVIDVYTVLRWHPLYILCQLNHDNLMIHFPAGNLTVSYAQIVSCEKYIFSQGVKAGSTVNVKITLKQGTTVKKGPLTTNELYLVPVNPLEHFPSIPECEAMILVIQSYLRGETPTVPENPYFREFQRRGRLQDFTDTKWNAELPPSFYNPVPSLWRTLLKSLVFALLATILVMILFGLLYNLLY